MLTVSLGLFSLFVSVAILGVNAMQGGDLYQPALFVVSSLVFLGLRVVDYKVDARGEASN